MDQKLLFLINREWTGPALDRFMAFMSSLPAWMPILVPACLWLLWRGGFRARAFLLTVGLVVAISDGIVAKTMKRVIDRPRPHQVLDGVRQVDLAKATPRLLALAKPAKVKLSEAAGDIEKIEGRSFPSGHTMNMISAALVTAFFFPRYGWLAFGLALLVGYSRVYVGSHWPSDVVTSIFLGLGLTLFLLATFELLWRWQAARFYPRLYAAHPSLFAP